MTSRVWVPPFRSVFAGWLLPLLVSLLMVQAAAPPEITEVQPPTGAMNVPRNSPVVMTFSVPMDTTATRAQFMDMLAFPPQALTMQTSWSGGGTQMVNTPVSLYAPMTQIQWQIITAQDVEGQPLEGLRGGTFLTGQIVGTLPQLVSSDPANQATNVAPNATVVFSFNVAMNQSATIARFYDVADLTHEVAVSSSWDIEAKVLTCVPVTSFPPGVTVVWHIGGSGADGSILPGAGGGFVTAATRETIAAVISFGEMFRQEDTDLFEMEGREFAAVAESTRRIPLAVSAPAGPTNLLSLRRGTAAMEYSDVESESDLFSAHYPPGEYRFLVGDPLGDAEAVVQLAEGVLPAPPRITGWRAPEHAVVGQPLAIAWTIDAGGAPVDCLRLKITRGGAVLFATPPPGATGALTGASNAVLVPASAFTDAGLAQVNLTAWSFTDLDTNSAPGVSLLGARHRTTIYDLRIVSGNSPPPTLITTNLAALPMDEPLFTQLVSEHGVRPIQYRVVSGELPPGVTLEASGILTGTATGEGVFESVVELTDLLGRSVTQAVRLAAVPLPAGSLPPNLESPAVVGGELILELVDPTPLDTVIDRSEDLDQWTPCYTNTAAAKRATVRQPVSGEATFLRARATANYPPQPPADPLTVEPVVNPDAMASARLNEWGGTVSLTNGGGFVFTLAVPPGALDRTETITMTAIAQVGGLPLSGGLIAAVDLQPEGLLFDLPVRLDITAPTPVELTTLAGFNAENAGTRFGLQPSFLTNNTISLHLRHFSLAGAGNGSADDMSGQTQRPPDEGSRQSDQEAANEMARCRMDPNCDIDSEEQKNRLREIFVRQADQVILPKLREAVGDESSIEGAIVGWRGWLHQLALAVYDGDTFNAQGSGALETRMQLAQNLAGRALQNGIEKNCELCMRRDVSRIARVITFSRWAAALGFDPGNEPFSCMQKCLKFELKIESTIYSRDGDKTVGTITAADVNVTPLNVDGSSENLTLAGSGEWRIEDTEEVEMPEGCKMSAAPASGTAEVVLLRISLYRQESYSTDAGELVRYVWDPQVRLSLRADREEMPQEARMITCGDLVAVPMEDVFGPMFLAFHNDEVEIAEAGTPADAMLGGPVITIQEFVNAGGGGDFLQKIYVREQTLQNGAFVAEATTIKLQHKP